MCEGVRTWNKILQLSTWYVEFLIPNINLKNKERAKMSKIKNYAEDKYGEDWVHKLEDMERKNGKRK